MIIQFDFENVPRFCYICTILLVWYFYAGFRINQLKTDKDDPFDVFCAWLISPAVIVIFVLTTIFCILSCGLVKPILLSRRKYWV
jgi:hypothetical protein